MAASAELECFSCGAPIERDARFCGECGQRISSAGSISSAAPASQPTALAHKPYARSRSADRVAGRVLNNRYSVGPKIGEGGFGAVFKGTQLSTGREVALKVLHPQSVSDKTVVARFRREAEACSKLRNRHTVITFDFDETEDGILYLAMELLRGTSLEKLQKRMGPLPVKRVLLILDQIAQALGEAHQQGIIHRDMKPENVMIEPHGGDQSEDYVKVLDFGIAKIVTGDGSRTPALTAVGQTIGTLEFMSPEQLRGKQLDGRSDIYALGMMAYEMLTGSLPFRDAKTSSALIDCQLGSEPLAPSDLAPDQAIPVAVDTLVEKMVAKAPADRHHNTAELRDHIRDVLESVDADPGRQRRVRAIAIVVGVAIGLAVAGLLLSG